MAWDVYGSEWPRGEMRRALQTVAVQLEQGALPELGKVLWGIYPKPWGGIESVARGIAERIYFAKQPYARGVLEGLHNFGVLE